MKKEQYEFSGMKTRIKAQKQEYSYVVPHQLTKGQIEDAPGSHRDVYRANNRSAMMKWTFVAAFMTLMVTCHSLMFRCSCRLTWLIRVSFLAKLSQTRGNIISQLISLTPKWASKFWQAEPLFS